MMIDLYTALPNIEIQTFFVKMYLPFYHSPNSHHHTPRPFDRSTLQPKQSNAQPLIPPLSWQYLSYSARTTRNRTTTAVNSATPCLHKLHGYNLFKVFAELFSKSDRLPFPRERCKNRGRRRILPSPPVGWLKTYACAASTILANLAGTREAPPMSPPSTLTLDSSSAALPSFMEPPYWIVISSAAFSP